MDLWQKTTDRLRTEIGQAPFETWISPLSYLGLQGKTATISAPNKFFRDCVQERYHGLLSQSLSAEAGEALEVNLTAADRVKEVVEQVPAKPAERPAPSVSDKFGRELHPKLNPRYTFPEFVIGSSNQFAHAAALAVARQPGEKYNPLFIYGGVGLGKTHLASAIGHHLWTKGDRPRKVLFMPAEVFMNELIGSLRRDRMNEFREKFRRVDALILDDVQFLAGRERTQEEFFHTFNSLHGDRHQIVLTSDKVPRDITGLEERLRNRFESGLIADIAAPDLETRIAILQKKAVLEHIALEPEVAMYIAQNVSSNVRELEGCLTRLAALASMKDNAPITVEFTRMALRDLICDHEIKPNIDTIQKTVSDFFHIRLSDLKSKKRTQHIAFCRQVAMYLCRKLTDSSFPAIGSQFGRDHSTVIHAYNLIAGRVGADSPFRLSIEKIERMLGSYRHNGTSARNGNHRDAN